jgi:Holliday junction resolvase RusA-like endonuclease
VIEFTVYGKPQPAGSKRAFVKGGRAIVVDDAKGSRPWKQEVTGAAVRAMHDAGLTTVSDAPMPGFDGPLVVTFAFYVDRPKGHYGVRDLKKSAPPYPIVRPDLLKLARAVEDALTGVVYRDDSQIVRETLEKHYGLPERVEVRVEPVAVPEGEAT